MKRFIEMLIAFVLFTESACLVSCDVAGGGSILIGLLLPPEEAEATSLRQGVQLGVDHANQAPGPMARLLVRGRIGQWGTDAEEASRMVLDDGVRGLIAPPGGVPSHLALQVSGRTATPVVSLCPDSSVTGAGVPWMVRLAPGTCDEAELIFSATKTTRSGRRFQWWALVPDERAGREVAKDLSKAAKATGSTLKNPVKVSPKLSDFSNIIEPMLAAKPDGILLWLDPLLAGRLAKSLRGAGFTGKLAGPSRLSSTNFTSSAGIAAEGFLLPSPLLDQASKVVFAQFALDYRRRFGNEPDLAACMAYDAAMLLIDIFRKSSDKPAHRAFPLACQPPGASGSLRFDSTGNRLARLELLEFRSGRFAQFADHNAHK